MRKSNNQKEDRFWRPFGISLLLFLVGLSMFWGIDYFIDFDPAHKSLGYVASHKIPEALISAGALGILFRMLFYNNLKSSFIEETRNLFNEDITLARSLNDAAREQRVENTLKAHLGSELGGAIHTSLVARYFSSSNTFRRNMTEDVTIDDLEQDITIISPKSSSLLIPDDILDWSTLLTTLQKEGGSKSLNPAKRICELLPPQVQLIFNRDTQPTELESEDMSSLIRALNNILAQRDFYRAPYFEGLNFSDETKLFIALNPASMADAEVRRRNRLLLEDSYPQIVATSNPPESVTLSTNSYYRVTVRSTYERNLDEARDRIGCILVEDPQELNNWFGRTDCLFRDVVGLNQSDRDKTLAMFENLDPEGDRKLALSIIEKIFKVTVKVDGHYVLPDEIKLTPGNNSIEIRLCDLKRFGKDKRVLYEVTLESVMSKSVKRYPIILVDPCENPQITFSYPAVSISNVNPFVFFTGKDPFSPKIDQRPPREKRVIISLPRWMGDQWVFPNSGIIFTWDTN
jgi:hypothetical protein